MSGRILRDDQAMFAYASGERAIAGGIDAIDTGALDRNRAGDAVQTAAMARRINAHGEAAGDNDAGIAKFAGKTLGRDFTVAGRVATADDGKLRSAERCNFVAVDPQRQRCIGNLGETFGIVLGAKARE